MKLGRRLVIAIDGNSASGKGTLARGLAEHYHTKYLPTGNLYRILAKRMIENGISSNDFVRIKRIIDMIKYEDLFSNNLQDSAISSMASIIATNDYIRNSLCSFQRAWAENHRIAILEGRDIGTVICPDADVKIFLTASLEARANRRLEDFIHSGDDTTYDKVYLELKERDARDLNRKTSPLLQADDAVAIDSSLLSPGQVLTESIKIIEKQIDKNERNL